METIERFISPRQLQTLSGVGAFSFNTLYKLVWLKENHPRLLEQAHCWLFISSLINHRLTGEFTTDITMAGTSQLLISISATLVRKSCRRRGWRAACSRVSWKRAPR